MKREDVKRLLDVSIDGPSKWELDNVTWYDRTSNPRVLTEFLKRIDELDRLDSDGKLTDYYKKELSILLELLEDLDEKESLDLLNQTDDEAKDLFIEDLARTAAIEVLTNGKTGFETMTIACKLSPNDFILYAKRTQDLINAIHGLVIKGETLSQDVAGA